MSLNLKYNRSSSSETYTHEDLNRVGAAVNIIAAELGATDIHAAEDLTAAYVPQQNEMDALLAAVRRLKDLVAGRAGTMVSGGLGNATVLTNINMGAAALKANTKFTEWAPPALPESMSGLTYDGANAIEKNLADIYELAVGDIY